MAESFCLCVSCNRPLQDEEQLKLSTQQSCLLQQQLSDAQSHAASADKQVLDEQLQLQRLERRMAALQGQAEEQQAQIRYSRV